MEFAENHVKQAIELFKENKNTLALEQYRKAIEIETKLPLKNYIQLADILIKKDFTNEALEVAKLATKMYPTLTYLYYSVYCIFISKGDLKNAFIYYNKCLEMSPDNKKEKYYERCGDKLLNNNFYKKAEEIYLELLSKYPNNFIAHNGLIRIAMTFHEWELALERLDLAIDCFPDNLILFLKKINILNRLHLLDLLEKTITKGKKVFRDEIEIDIAEAQFYQQKYDYKTANNILDIAIYKEPNNVKIQLEKAYNFWLIGENKYALEILNKIKLKLEEDRKLLPDKFINLYLNILVSEKEIDRLNIFFQEARQNSETKNKYILHLAAFLIAVGKYEEAEKFIREILGEHFSECSIYQNQILLIFYLERIKNIQAFSSLDFSNLFNYQVNKKSYSLLDKLKSHLENHPEFETVNNFLITIFNKIDKLSEVYPNVLLNTETSPRETYEVARKIIEHITNKIPLSLIRLGDGEGMFLEYKKKWQKFQERDREITQKIWWGSVKINQYEWQKLKSDYILAIQKADILGIPEASRICRSLQFMNPKNQTHNSRGLLSIIDNLHSFRGDGKSYPQQHYPTLTSCHIHEDLEVWGFWKLILDRIKDCSLISCHKEVSQFLQKKHEVIVTKFYKIPSEYKYSQLFGYDDNNQSYQSHYPDCFDFLYREITVNYPGEVFLVAAGFLGKIYCNIIKQRGGIALDIGSIADYWLNYSTRIFLFKAPRPIHYNFLFTKTWEI